MDKKEYCTQNDGDCASCSLVNYGRDCYNNSLKIELPPYNIKTWNQKRTILAALRYFQRNYPDAVAFGIENNFFDEEEPLTETDIDKLCEDINCDE